MYDVTDTYKTLIKQPTRYVGIRGAVKLRSGEIVQFTEKNIVSGSLSITDRLNRRGDFRPGGVYSSGLSIGFTGLFARTNDLDGAVIRLNYFIYPNAEMKLSEAEAIPLGRFYVDGSTIKRNRSTVRLKADDALMLFDIPTTERSGTLYELVTGSCAAAGVNFGMTQAEFEALPNATLSAAINTARVQNERDLMMYVGMLTGSFARVTRAGQALEFRPLTCEKDSSTHVIIPAREIAGNIRFTTDFSDDTTRIAKLIMRRNGTALTSTLSVTIGGSEKLATLELDENPLMSAMSDSDVKTALNAILTQLFPCLNRVFNVEFTGDPALEVGDYVRLHGGEIDTDRGYATGMITSQTWTFHGAHRIQCSMPASLVYSGEETAAVMALADDTAVSTASTTSPTERVQPKSQIQKRVDAIEAELKNSSGTAEKLQTSGSSIWADTVSGSLSVHSDAQSDPRVPFAQISPGSTNLEDGFSIQSPYGATVKVSKDGVFICNTYNRCRIQLDENGIQISRDGSDDKIEIREDKTEIRNNYMLIGDRSRGAIYRYKYGEFGKYGMQIECDGGYMRLEDDHFLVQYGGNTLVFSGGTLFVNGKKVLTE